jgi:hypothetical protein
VKKKKNLKVNGYLMVVLIESPEGMCFLLFLCFLKKYKIFSPFVGLYTPRGGAYITDSNLSRDTLAFKFFHLFNETLLPSRYTFSTYEASNEREMNARLFSR